jgi:pyruvate/2-oxoglutarate dehydrogenase complex dihydrolipoamide acyltransferase (E2) component
VVKELTVPKLGNLGTTAVVIHWKKQTGEWVNKGDALVKVETDKAVIEISAQASGMLFKLLAQPGDTISVGAPIALIAEVDGG